MALIPLTNIVKVRRKVRKATEAACRSTYKPLGGRPYEEVYLNSEAPTTDFDSMRAARHERQMREWEEFRPGSAEDPRFDPLENDPHLTSLEHEWP